MFNIYLALLAALTGTLISDAIKIPSWNLKINFNSSMKNENPQHQQLFKSLYDKHILSKISPEKTPKIPKISHMIWFGNEFPARFHLERELFMKEHKEWVHILWVDNPKNYIFGNIIENPYDIVHLVNDSTLQGKSFIIDIKNFKLHNQQFFDKAVKN